jgi:mediator of RNA polymerase II transcription subunit 17
MSENLTKLVHKIDFSKPVESVEEIDTLNNLEDNNNNDKTTDTQNKELASFQPSLWPWDSIRNKLR